MLGSVRNRAGEVAVKPSKLSLFWLVPVFCLQATTAAAQDFAPDRTMTLVVGYAAGSLYDANARFVAGWAPG